MATIKATVLAEDMEAVLIVQPPYETPGTTSWNKIMDGKGCDCSGVPAAIFARHGGKLPHGSNTIARKYLDSREKLSKASQLQTGMAVFKWKQTGCSNAAHEKDGQGNFHHIGIVTSTKPLRIVHQSSSAGHTACDTSISKWAYCGRLKGVNYEIKPQEDKPMAGQAHQVWYTAKVTTSDSGLNIRSEASTKAKVIGSVPKGRTIDVLDENQDGTWAYMDYKGVQGWVSTRYIKEIDEVTPRTDDPQNQVKDDPSLDVIEREEFERVINGLQAQINDLKKIVDDIEGGNGK